MKSPIPTKQLPLAATAVVLVLLFGTASGMYPSFLSLRVVVNLFYDNSVLGISAIGMTFVILAGGIDLSVGSVIAFTTIFVATAIDDPNHGGWGCHPLTAWTAALALGAGFGALMGLLIQVYRLPAFLVTLGGMFFARGMAFVVRKLSLGIEHSFYDGILAFNLPLSGGVAVRAVPLFLIAMLGVAFYLAHYTRFGRNVYAVGGSEQSAVLMGLPVTRTVVGVYAFNGCCSALAGIVFTLYTGSGNPAMGVGLELDAIAAVVIGGTLLTGGVGYVFGTLLGVLIFGTIKTALDFDGRLDAAWLRIAIGVLLLIFILLQRAIARGGGARQNT